MGSRLERKSYGEFHGSAARLGKSPLAQELETFLTYQPEWLRTDPGKYALIKGEEVLGLYDRQEDAFAEGYRHFRRKAFMVQRIQESFDTYYFGGSGIGHTIRTMS